MDLAGALEYGGINIDDLGEAVDQRAGAESGEAEDQIAPSEAVARKAIVASATFGR